MPCWSELYSMLMVVQMSCPTEFAAATDFISPFFHMNASQICTSPEFGQVMASAMQPNGVLADVAACAVRHSESAAHYLRYMSWPTFKVLVCGPHVFEEAAPTAAASTWYLGLGVLQCVLFATCAAAVVVSWFRGHLRTGTPPRGDIVLLFIALISLSAPLSWYRERAVELDDFFAHDDVTACSRLLQDALPDAGTTNLLIGVTAPAASIRQVYDEVRDLSVDNVSLASLCGHCGLMADAHLTKHLVLHEPLVKHDSLATLTIDMPASTPKWWRVALANRMRNHVEGMHRVAFSSREQTEYDVHDALHGRPEYGVASVVAVLVGLYVMLWCTLRCVVPTILLTCGVILLIGASLVVGDAIAGAMHLHSSSYNIIVAPLLLGISVDSALILLGTYSRTASFLGGWPSIVASYLTTICGFGAGLAMPVTQLRSFFAQCIISLLACATLQFGALPCLLRMCVQQVAEPRGMRSRGTRAWKIAVVLLGCAWLATALRQRPIRSEFNVHHYQVWEESQTFKFASAMVHTPQLSNLSAVHIVTHDTPLDEINWTDVYAKAHVAKADVYVDWHKQLQRAGKPFETWIGEPAVQVAFGPFINRERNATALLALQPFDAYATAATHAAELGALHELSSSQFCFANNARLGGYTVEFILRRIWTVVAVSVIVAFCTGLAIAGPHGICAGLAILLSYVLSTFAIGALGVRVHLMSVAVFVIAPGLLVDYTLHVVYNPDTVRVVLCSAALSIASMLPYTAIPLGGLRDFAVVYVIFVAIGVLHALTVPISKYITYHLANTVSKHESEAAVECVDAPKV